MKKTILSICITGLMLTSLGLSVNAFGMGELSIKLEAGGYTLTSERGNTLITEFGGNETAGRVIEVDGEGNIVWQKTDLFWPSDVERFTNQQQPPLVEFINPKDGYFHLFGVFCCGILLWFCCLLTLSNFFIIMCYL